MPSEIAKAVAKTVTVSNYSRAFGRGSLRTQDVEICEVVDVQVSFLARELRQAIEGQRKITGYTSEPEEYNYNHGIRNALTAFDEVCQRYGVEVQD